MASPLAVAARGCALWPDGPHPLPRAARLGEHQHGVLTRRQLLEGGVTPAQLRTRLGREWRLVLRGVVLLSNAVPNEQQRLMAAQLFAGPRSWLAGPTAAALHGIGDLTVTNPIHVLVPAPLRSRTHAWVVVRNTTLLDEPLHRRGPLRVSCPARAAVDAAAAAPSDEVARAVLVSAARSRTARMSDLLHWVLARGQVGSHRLHAGLSVAASGAWSLPEAELLRLLSSSTVLPQLWPTPSCATARGTDSPPRTSGSTTWRWRSWCTAGSGTRASASGSRRSSTTPTCRPHASSSSG